MQDNIAPKEKLLKLNKKEKKHSPPKKASFDFSLKYLSLSAMPKIIFLAFLVSLLYLAFTFIYPALYSRKNTLALDIESKEALKPKLKSNFKTKPLEYYLEAFKGRQIFSAAIAQETNQPITKIDSAVLQDISLVGIISGDNPQAIIEDKSSQKTYSLIKGQYLKDIQIQDIQGNKVIINYKGQKFELYL